MDSSNIALNFFWVSLLLFSRNVYGLKRNTSHDKPSDNSFLQVKSNFEAQGVQQPTVSAPQVPTPVVDPEGVKKAVAATLLANQAAQLSNGPLPPSDLSNLQTPAALSVPPVPQTPVVDSSPAPKGDNSSESSLNVVLDPSLENISRVDKGVKNAMEHAVHSLKKALEAFTNLTALLDNQEQVLPFTVEGDDYTVRSTLDLLNKSLKQNENAQKVLFQADAFVLSLLTKAASGKPDEKNKGS